MSGGAARMSRRRPSGLLPPTTPPRPPAGDLPMRSRLLPLLFSVLWLAVPPVAAAVHLAHAPRAARAPNAARGSVVAPVAARAAQEEPPAAPAVSGDRAPAEQDAHA